MPDPFLVQQDVGHLVHLIQRQVANAAERLATRGFNGKCCLDHPQNRVVDHGDTALQTRIKQPAPAFGFTPYKITQAWQIAKTVHPM